MFLIYWFFLFFILALVVEAIIPDLFLRSKKEQVIIKILVFTVSLILSIELAEVSLEVP